MKIVETPGPPTGNTAGRFPYSQAVGSSMDRVVNATFVLARSEDFGAMYEEWASWLPANPPARSGARHPLGIPGLLISMAVIAEATR